jgi:hypothetical protein
VCWVSFFNPTYRSKYGIGQEQIRIEKIGIRIGNANEFDVDVVCADIGIFTTARGVS